MESSCRLSNPPPFKLFTLVTPGPWGALLQTLQSIRPLSDIAALYDREETTAVGGQGTAGLVVSVEQLIQ